VIPACSGLLPAQSVAAAGHTDEKPPLKPPNKIAKANTCASVFAKPHSRKAAIPLPNALMNMIHGYGKRSLRWPMRICPTTPEELNSDKTIVAESGDPTDLVNVAIYNETGKYDKAWIIFVAAKA